MTLEKNKNIFQHFYVGFILLGFLLLPAIAHGATRDVAVWIPWWTEEAGVKSAEKNIKNIDIIYPFVFEVNSDGTLNNRVDFEDRHWEKLIDKAGKERIKVIPTIAWFDGAQIHSILENKTKRKAHVKDIVNMVEDNGFDGVNIDYESKLGETIDYYSTFLKELKDELDDKDLTCTIEARTPPDSRWKEIPREIKYANDYEAINEHCDWVEIMAYDQQRADLKLNEKRRGLPYMPVADIEWVDKVVKLALEDIDKDKILLGVATYGRAFDITVAPDWYRDYKQVSAINHPRILELSKKYNSPIGRTAGGEAVISYFPDDSPWHVFNALPTPQGTPKGYEAAAKALLVANYAKIEVPVRFITWSDAVAVKEKISLADKYGLKGVAVFKVDGEEDSAIWKSL